MNSARSRESDDFDTAYNSLRSTTPASADAPTSTVGEAAISASESVPVATTKTDETDDAGVPRSETVTNPVTPLSREAPVTTTRDEDVLSATT